MLYFLIIASLFASDSMIKSSVEKKMKTGDSFPLLQGKLLIKKSHNSGAVFNIGEKRQRFIAQLSLLLTAFVAGIFAELLGQRKRTLTKTGFAFILGGAFSNTFDRFKRGYVVDYLSFPVLSWKKRQGRFGKLSEKMGRIVFNISDFGIIAGSVLLILDEWTRQECEESLY